MTREFMLKAIEVARDCKPADELLDPHVGAVLVRDEKIIATAFREETGTGDHAEFAILAKKKRSDEDLSDATLYVTLEPCCVRGEGKTPCADRIVASGIRRVVIGVMDPNPDICNIGATRLRNAGIEVREFDEDLQLILHALNKKFEANHKTRPKLRGQFWQVIFDAKASPPIRGADLEEFRFSERVELSNRVIRDGRANPTLSDKKFVRCDFSKQYSQLSFVRVHFENCDFDHGHFERVKFHDCVFKDCNFSTASFDLCHFLGRGTIFDNISVSSNLMIFRRTAIDPKLFIGGIATNLKYLPDGYSEEGQRLRLEGTRAKIARALFHSNAEAPTSDYTVAAAREQGERQTRARVATARLRTSFFGSGLVLLHQIMGAVARWHGHLTGWGTSLVRPLLAFAAVAVVFTAAFWLAGSLTLSTAALKAVENTLVFGYEPSLVSNPPLMHVLSLLDATMGAYLYILVISAMVRRFSPRGISDG